MKEINLNLIKKTLRKAEVPFTPLAIYKKSKLKISYRTYLRGIIELMKTRDIFAYKISHGRGKGINWIITNNELVQNKEKRKA